MQSKLAILFLLILSSVPIKSAMDLNGSNQSFSGGTGLNQAGEMTACAWIVPDVIDGNGGFSNANEVIWNGTNGGQQNYGLEYDRTNARLSIIWGDVIHLTGATNLIAGQWHHVAVTRSGSSGSWTGKLYLNGVEDASGSIATNPNGGGGATTLIGAGGNTDTTPSGRIQYHNGLIDDVRIYNRALSASEIESIYLSRSRLLNTTGLVGYWRLDEGLDLAISTGNATIIDSSGNGNHGTPANGPTYRASSVINYP